MFRMIRHVMLTGMLSVIMIATEFGVNQQNSSAAPGGGYDVTLLGQLGSGTITEFEWLDATHVAVAGSFGYRLFDVTNGESVELPFDGRDYIAFSPDGLLAATMDQPDQISLWSVPSGERLISVKTDTYDNHFLFSPTGRALINIRWNDTCEYWPVEQLLAGNTQSQEFYLPFSVERHSVIPSSPLSSPDNLIVAFGDWAGNINLFHIQHLSQLADAVPVRTFEGHGDSVSEIMFSPDGQRLLSVSYSSGEADFRQWDVASGRQLDQLSFAAGGGILLCPDAKHALISRRDEEGKAQKVELWDLDRRRVVAGSSLDLNIYSYNPNSAFSPEGRWLVYVDTKGTIRVLDITTNTERILATDYNWKSVQVRFNARGDLALISHSYSKDLINWNSAPFQRNVTIWNVATQTTVVALEASLAIFSPDGLLVAVGDETGAVRVLDAYTGTAQQIFAGNERPIYSLAFQPDGTQLAVGDASGTVRFWHVDSGQAGRSLISDDFPKSRLIFSPNGRWLVAIPDTVSSTAVVWNLEPTSTMEISFRAEFIFGINDVAFSPDETVLALGGSKISGATLSGVIHLYDTPTGQLVAAVGGQWMPDELPDVTQENMFDYYHSHAYPVNNIVFALDGIRLASGSGDAVRIWHVPTATQHRIGVNARQVEGVNEQIYEFDLPGADRFAGEHLRIDAGDMVFNPTLSLLAFGDIGGDIHLLDLSDPDHVHETVLNTGQESLVRHSAFSFDGRLLAVSSSDTFQIWDTVTLLALPELPLDLLGVWQDKEIQFGPNAYLFTVFDGWHGNKGIVQFWQVSRE